MTMCSICGNVSVPSGKVGSRSDPGGRTIFDLLLGAGVCTAPVVQMEIVKTTVAKTKAVVVAMPSGRLQVRRCHHATAKTTEATANTQSVIAMPRAHSMVCRFHPPGGAGKAVRPSVNMYRPF